MKNINEQFADAANNMPLATDVLSKNLTIGKLEINTLLFIIAVSIIFIIVVLLVSSLVMRKKTKDNKKAPQKYPFSNQFIENDNTKRDETNNKDSLIYNTTTEKQEEKPEQPKADKTSAAKATPDKQSIKVQDSNEITESEDSKRPTGKFEIILKADGYRFYLLANNGQLLYESLGYTKPGGALRGIDTFKRAVEKGDFVVDEDKFGRYRFILNKRYVGENYSTKTQCESSIESVRNFSKRALVVPYEEDPQAEKEYEKNANNNINFLEWSEIQKLEEDIKPSGKFEIEKSSNGFHFYLIANNGQLLYSSNGYSSIASAKDGIKSFKKAVYANNFILDKDKFGRYRFVLKGGNLNATYVGESYTTKHACENIINSVKNFSKSAVMPD